MGSFYGGGTTDVTVHMVSETGSSVNMSTIIGTMPFYYAREYLPTSDKTSITIYANTQININNKGYLTTRDTTLSTAGIAEPGKDIYIYACAPTSSSSTSPVFVLSQNSTVPDGYNADNSRKIGGFHCLCADVGEISGHALSGYVAGDILPASVWDLEHRPICNPEGMVYDEGTRRWYDIYLSSWNGSQLVSEYNGVIATGITSTAFHGLKFNEELGKIGKRLPWRHEFMCAVRGSNEQTAISGASDPTTTGGHVDSTGTRMISDIGLEDCCGCAWQWINDEYDNFQYGHSGNDMVEAYWNNGSSHKYFTNYDWTHHLDDNGENVTNYDKDVDSEYRGDSYGLLRQGHVGGYWNNGSNCGSRSIITNNFGSSISAGVGARGTADRK